jgi:hypothetical protein
MIQICMVTSDWRIFTTQTGLVSGGSFKLRREDEANTFSILRGSYSALDGHESAHKIPTSRWITQVTYGYLLCVCWKSANSHDLEAGSSQFVLDS